VFEPSAGHIIAGSIGIVLGTASWYVRGQFPHKWRLAEMDKETKCRLAIERARRSTRTDGWRSPRDSATAACLGSTTKEG
jgi:hypothetical protein